MEDLPRIGARALIAPRYRVFCWVLPIVAASCLSLAVLDPNQEVVILDLLGVAYIVGTFFAQVTLSAAWTAFGPGRLVWRLPLSLLWVLSVIGALAFNFWVFSGGDDLLWVLAGLLFGQWLVLQPVLWGMRLGFQFELLHSDDTTDFDPQKWQFGIRQLMIVTAIVGVTFGMGRLFIANIPPNLTQASGEPIIFLFLCISAILFSLPLLLATLLKRGMLLGVPLILALIAVGTYFEEPLLNTFSKRDRPNLYDMIAINVFTSGLILVVAATVRLCGYSLTRLRKGTTLAA